MTAKSHMVMNIASAGVLFDTAYLLSNTNAPEWMLTVARTFNGYFFNQNDMPQWLFVSCGILLYLFGTLFPDIDHENSTFGKKFHVPVKHRTWLHSIWFPIIFFVIGAFWVKLFAWIGAGILLHLWWDSLSASGIDWFYPIKFKHKCKVYYTGSMSEYVVVGVFCTLVVVYTIVCLQCVHHFVNVSW